MGWIRAAFAAATLAVTVAPARATIWNVFPDGSGDAPTIQAAVDAAVAGDTVLLAPGVYKDTVTRTLNGTSTKSVVFLKSGVTLTSSDGADATTIDGELSHHCVVGQDLGPATIVSGITMANGHALSSSTGAAWGGAMLFFRSAVIIEDNRFESCAAIGGGALLAWDRFVGGDAIIIRRNVFWNNHATDLGGAIEMVSNAFGLVENNTFAGNRADDRGGAILSNSTGTSVTISRNIFWSNTAGSSGGAVACIGNASPTTLGDCNLFWLNTGGGSNEVLSCNLVVGMNGNALADPLFCDEAGGDFHLHGDSPGAPGYSGGCGLIGALGVGCAGGLTTRLESRSALPGMGVVIPISLTGVLLPGYGAYEATVTYDPSILSFDSIQVAGTLSAGRLAFANETTPGTLRIAVAGAGDIVGEGSLADLLFDVSPAATVGQSSALAFQAFTWEEGEILGITLGGTLRVEAPLTVDGTVSYYAGGTPIPGADVRSTGGVVATAVSSGAGAYQFGSLSTGSDLLITATILAGDNGAITSMDASDVLRHVVQLAPFNALQLLAADVTGNGSVSVADAGLILEIVTGTASLPDPLWLVTPASIELSSLATSQSNQDFAGILVGDPSGNWAPVGPGPVPRTTEPGWTVVAAEEGDRIVLRVAAAKAALAAQVRLEFDPSLGLGDHALPADGLWRLKEEPGRLVAAGARETPWPAGQELLVAPFPASAAGRDVVVEVRIEERDPGRVTLRLPGAEVALGPLDLRVGPVPSAGAITFSISGPPEPFRVEVFDVTGRRVRAFDGTVAAGGVRLTWDARDEGGERIGSGIYFVRLTGSGGTVTRRAVLSQ